MPEIFYSDDHVTLHHGDALATLATLPDASVDCIVTSPPYFGLRDYGVDGQIGAEPTPAEFVAALTDVFREARRVLADDGVMFVNLGDSYIDKDLVGIPWMVTFALKADGWILRNDIIWRKLNALPERVADRMSSKHEYVFMFSKRARYWFDLDSVREPAITADRPLVPANQEQRSGSWSRESGGNHREPTRSGLGRNEAGKNPGDIWSIPTTPFPGAHFATMPPALAERAILAGCRPGGVVLDPFSGSGTTGMAAAKHGRRYVGIELNEEYLALSLRTRLAQGVLDFGGAA